MRIEPKTVTPITSFKAREQAPSASKADDSSRSSVVNLSSAGVAATAHADRPGMTERVAQIRAAVAAGQYPINLDKLASRIVDDEVHPRRSTS